MSPPADKQDPSQKNLRSPGWTTKILHPTPTNETPAGEYLTSDEHPHGAVHTPMQSSVTYTYPKVEALIDAFQGRGNPGFTYARAHSPTIAALEKRITRLENGIDTLSLSTGMAGILLPLLALLKKGDHVLTSQHIFGNTVNLFHTLRRVGLEVDFVDTSDIASVKAKLRPQTRILFFETLSNPLTMIPDIAGLSALGQEENIITIVDNTITTPYLFQPKDWQFSFAHHSLTKYIGGHAAALGGSITDLGNEDWSAHPNVIERYRTKTPSPAMAQMRKKGMRDMGSTLSAHHASLIALGMETFALRMDRICANAVTVAAYLDKHPKVQSIYHPSLASHPQHDWAKKWFTGSSGILSFELGKVHSMPAFMNALKVFSRATHLGDTRSLAIPVAPTIFFELGSAGREELGIHDNLIRLSIGIEDEADLIGDLDAALACC